MTRPRLDSKDLNWASTAGARPSSAARSTARSCRWPTGIAADRGRRARLRTPSRLVADEMRRRQAGDVVTYVVNRNINFTNVCIKHCTFCAFSRDHREEEGYFLPMDEVVRRAIEAWEMGATEVCIQAGLPPKLDGRYYVDLCRAIKAAVPEMHLHAFSPEEILYGSTRVGHADPRLPDARSRPRGSARCPAPRRRSSTRRSATSSPRAASPSSSGSRSSPPRTRWASAPPRPSCTGTSSARSTGSATWISCAASSTDTGGFTEFVPLSLIHRRRRCTAQGWCPACGRAPPGIEVIKMHALARLILGPTLPQHPGLVGEGGPEARAATSSPRAPTTSAARSSTSPSRPPRARAMGSSCRPPSSAGSSATRGACPPGGTPSTS